MHKTQKTLLAIHKPVAFLFSYFEEREYDVWR